MSPRPSFVHTLLHCLIASIRAGSVITLLLACAVMLLSGQTQAQTEDENDSGESISFTHPHEVKQGSLLFRGKSEFISAPVLHTDVQFTVTGMIIRAHVKQRFSNPDDDWKEGIYVFPLPEDAAVDHMRMHIGERIIEGKIQEKSQAKQQYQQAKRAGKKASLVEQERPNIFTTSVANIAPHESITVEIQYQQVAKYDLGQFTLRFPMVVAPRYIPGRTLVKGFSGNGWASNTDEVADAARITPPVLQSDRHKINPVTINVELDTGFKLDAVTSPYHDINVHRHKKTHYRISLVSKLVAADRDFVLNWKPEQAKAPQAAFFKERKEQEDYSLLMLLPPQHEQGQALQREVIFVIDTSGSMAGQSIVQAKQALQLAIKRLKPGDTFNVIQFNSFTAQLFGRPNSVSPSSLQQAHHYVGALQAQGGTEMAAAIRAALTQDYRHTGVRQVIFLTDGSVGNEQALFQLIKRNLGDSRLFTVGIGSAPNSHFMNRAASFGRGAHTYIGNTNEVQEKMGELFRKLESPVLGDIEIHWPSDAKVESWPGKIPDLYLGEPLMLSAKALTLPDEVKVSGQLAGKSWEATLALKGGQNRAGVSVLWARRKIASLMDRRGNSEDANRIKQEITDTALKHHLVSKYTSLIAVDVTPVRQEQSLHSKTIPTNLPAGWTGNKTLDRMPRTATPATLYFLIGFLLLLISFLLSHKHWLLLRKTDNELTPQKS